MRMIAIHAQTERKRLDRSVRCAEKRRPWARKQRLRGLIRPDPAVCATAGAACGRKSLSSARIQAIFTSNDTPLGECRISLPSCPSQLKLRVTIWFSDDLSMAVLGHFRPNSAQRQILAHILFPPASYRLRNNDPRTPRTMACPDLVPNWRAKLLAKASVTLSDRRGADLGGAAGLGARDAPPS